MSRNLPAIEGWRDHVVVRRSPRARHIRFKIHPQGRLELVVPRNFNERYLPAILDRHESWVLRTLTRLDLSPGRIDKIAAPNQLQLAALGEHWAIQYLEDSGRYGCREQSQGLLRVSGGEHWQGALKRWLGRKGRAHLLPWLEQVAGEVGLDYAGAAVRGQRSRWGSCSASGRINLNYGLLFLPPRLVRYLFIHELCHTREMNHSPRYWRLVEQLEPEYRELDRALRRATSRLPAWLHADEVEAVS